MRLGVVPGCLGRRGDAVWCGATAQPVDLDLKSSQHLLLGVCCCLLFLRYDVFYVFLSCSMYFSFYTLVAKYTNMEIVVSFFRLSATPVFKNSVFHCLL